MSTLEKPPVDEDWEFSEEEERKKDRAVSEIKETDKYEFLQMVRQGLDRQEAANALGFHGRHFRALCSPKSRFYDEEFARSYGEVIGSVEHEQHRLERLRSEGFRRAMTDSDRLLEKYLMVYDPDWAVLRQRDVNVNVNALIEQRLKVLPTPLLKQVLDALDSQAEIEQAVDVEIEEVGEYDVRELEPGASS